MQAKLFGFLTFFLLLLAMSCTPREARKSLGSAPASCDSTYHTYYGLLHSHSNASDGKGTPDSAYKYAREIAKLDFFSLADHSRLLTAEKWQGVKRAAETNNQDGRFVTFWGFEWTSSSGHVAIINTEDYTTDEMPETRDLEGLDQWLSSRNGVAFFNHPGREDRKGNEFTHFSYKASKHFVGMELFNRTDGFKQYYYNDGYKPDDGGKGFFDEANGRGMRIGGAGSDDNHRATWGTEADFRLAILAKRLTRTDLLEALNNRRFFSTLDKNLSISFAIGDFPMGSVIKPGSYQLTVGAKDADGESFEKIEVMKAGKSIKSWDFDSPTPCFSTVVEAQGGDYYYVIVHQKDGDQAISSPIWVQAAEKE